MTSKRLLELFCGTKSVGKVFDEKGYDVVSLDYNPKFEATHTVDILTWDYKQYSQDYFNVIWASPDCTTWSLATGGKYRTKSNIWGKNEKATLGNNMILRLIEILKYFKCESWFIENPRGLLQHFPPWIDYMKEVNGNKGLVYYGNYNWGFPKPTNIWSNKEMWNEKLPIMDESTYEIRLHNKKNKKFYHSFKRNAEERSKIPPDLINRLYNLTEKIP
jgi:site-specific DNA-cytosine methylase